MKKRISIEGEAMAALNTIVGSASFTNRTEARKVHAVAQWLLQPMKEYTAAIEGIQDEHAEEVTEGEAPNQKKKMIVPDEKVKEYTAAIEAAKTKKYNVVFDIESFAFCNGLVDRVFERPEITKQNGLAGTDQARNIEQISAAFEGAVDEG